MVADPLDRAATAERLTAIAAAGGLSDRALARALELASESPPPAQWRAFLSRSLLFLGAALMLAGVIFFFAFNWDDLGRFAKLALLEVAVAGAAAGAYQFGRTAAGEAALTAAAILVGPLLAVYGQAYQTGADAWELFAFWAALVFPWVALARMPTLWLVEIALCNVAFALLWKQRLSPFHQEPDPIWTILALADGVAWLAGESLQRSALHWPRPRWQLRILTVAAFTFASPGAFSLAMDVGRRSGQRWLALILLVSFAGAAYLLSRRPERRDLFLLAVAGAAVLACVACRIGRMLFDASTNDVGSILMMALVVIAEAGALIAFLRRMGSAEVDEG